MAPSSLRRGPSRSPHRSRTPETADKAGPAAWSDRHQEAQHQEWKAVEVWARVGHHRAPGVRQRARHQRRSSQAGAAPAWTNGGATAGQLTWTARGAPAWRAAGSGSAAAARVGATTTRDSSATGGPSTARRASAPRGSPAGRHGRTLWLGAPEPERFVLLWVLAELQLEVEALMGGMGTRSDCIRNQGLSRNDGDDLGCSAGGALPGGARRGGRIHLLLPPTRWPAIDGERPGGIGKLGPPQVQVGAGQVGIVLVARTGGLIHGVDPDIASVCVPGERGQRGRDQGQGDRGGRDERSRQALSRSRAVRLAAPWVLLLGRSPVMHSPAVVGL